MELVGKESLGISGSKLLFSCVVKGVVCVVKGVVCVVKGIVCVVRGSCVGGGVAEHE